MSPRRFKLILWLLPLFIARSLLPIGFMVTFDDGAPRIVFCPSQISIPAGTDTALASSGHEHHHHHQHHTPASDDSQTAEQNHQSCPFAFAGAAPVAFADAFAAEPPASEAIASPPERIVPLEFSPAHPIRGPPALS